MKRHSVRIAWRAAGDAREFGFGLVWLAVPVVLLVAMGYAVWITITTYERVRGQAASYETLSSEVQSLRISNQRLRLLEAELEELRELQQQMLRLAGIEAAMGVDVDLLEEIRRSQDVDTLSTDPGLFLWPLQGEIIGGFNIRHPGVDIAGPRGRTVVAAGYGIVTNTGTDSRYGRQIVLEHTGDLETVYANLALHLVEAGDTVRVGQVIGLVGVGREGVEPHLHFEVRRDGEPADPAGLVQQELPDH